MGDPAIVTEGLTRDFASGRALDGLTVTVPAGGVLALLGPNGAGKTTTVRLLNGLLTPDAGRARVLGIDPATDGGAVRRRSGVLQDVTGLDDRLTARENVVFAGRLRGLDAGEAGRRTDELLERFGVADRAHMRVRGASTGQRKRMALARALLAEPEVLFLDEPTAGLDPAAIREVLDLVAGLAGGGRTVVLCTHFLAEADRLADRVAVLHRGRTEAAGTPETLAADLWRGMACSVDLGAPAGAGLLEAVRATPGILGAEASAEGIELQVADRAAVAALVARLSETETAVYGVVPRTPTLGDIYFAIQARIADREGHEGSGPGAGLGSVTEASRRRGPPPRRRHRATGPGR